MSSVHQMQVCTPPCSSPECEPLTPSYESYNGLYNDHVSTGLGIYGCSSQPETPPVCTPNTPPGSHEWNGQGPLHELPTMQISLHDQKWSPYETCTTSTSSYAIMDNYSSYPHCTIPVTATTSSISHYGFPVSHLSMEEIPTTSNYDSNSYLVTSAQERFQSPFQNGSELFLEGGLEMPSSNMPFIHPRSTATTPQSQSPALSNASSPMSLPICMEYQRSTTTMPEETLRRWSSSSASSVSALGRTSSCQRVRQRGARSGPFPSRSGPFPFNCAVPGCNRGFDRQFNYNKHLETHQHRERPEKCPFADCLYFEKGFVRPHDLKRHIDSVGVLPLIDWM
jgi:hypothetical protein